MPKKKKRVHRPFPILLAVAAVFACCQAGSSVATIRTAGNQALQIKIEIADTPEERSRGLMFRENLPEGEGMLFVFPTETTTPFWMKDTPISLDLIFVRNGRIVDIIENAEPNSETLLTPDTPYNRVLEIAGGGVSRQGIKAGDTMDSP